MNRKELAIQIAKETQVSIKKAEQMISSFTDQVGNELMQGGKVMITNFGTFGVSNWKERTIKDVNTGEERLCETIQSPYFKPSKALRERVKTIIPKSEE